MYNNAQCPLITNDVVEPSKKLSIFHEIAVFCDHDILPLFLKLSPVERIMCYYLYRAGLVANDILTDQHHRDARALQQLFIKLYHHKDRLAKVLGEKFAKEVETYLVYLLANHGQYFKREMSNNKRTPSKIGLTTLTRENLIKALTIVGINNPEDYLENIESALFDADHENTLTVTGSIEKSAVNIYQKGFTKNLYDQISVDKRGQINAAYHIENAKPVSILYKIGGMYSKELNVASHWLQQAHDLAIQNPCYFDIHFAKSLDYLITFLKTGNEEDFKKHSREWLKTKSKIDYTFGFIETYEDPMETTGSIQAEITIKTIDLSKLSALLPGVEAKLPVDPAYKRSEYTIPNASTNAQLFGGGDLGPLKITLAYCLPNYADIRAEDGSKQIMYPAPKSLFELIDRQKSIYLFNHKKQADWLAKHDPEGQLIRDIDNLQTILHETIGHASGKLAQHTFKAGDILTIGNKNYKVGDTISIANTNINELLNGYEGTLEELRAEIIALYTSIHHLDEFVSLGFLKPWYKLLGKEKLTEWLIYVMTSRGLRRLLSQPDGAKEVAGHHARANMTILNYLIQAGGVAPIEETITYDNKKYHIVDVCVTNLEKAKKAITKLLQLVQQIKSTGDGQSADELIKTYGIKPKKSEWFTILKANQNAIVGNLKVLAQIYPRLHPVYNDKGNIFDITASWPDSLIDQQIYFSKLALKKE